MNPKAQALIENIQEELQIALDDAVVGKPLRPYMIGTLKRTAQAVLIRKQIRTSHINVVQHGTAFVVSITLPPQGPIVTAVRLRFGSVDPLL